jgi:hypothetical protein
MKKQNNPNIKAHLLRGAFYLLLLVTVCAIPLALAQRNVSKRTNARGVPHLKQKSLHTGFTNAFGTAPFVGKKSLRVPFLLKRSPDGCPSTITQSTSNTVEQGDSVSCNNGLETTENHYWRAFNMNDFTGGLAYTTTSLDMGVELAVSGGVTLNSVTVNIYSNHGSPFPGGDWQSNLVGTSGPVDIPDQQLTFPVNIPVTATVEAGALEMVLEVVGADGQGLGNEIFIGANSDPETGLSYVSAADCGIFDPIPTGDVGFPNTHWVFFVNGGCGAASPTPTATATAAGSPSPTPTSTPGGCGWSAGADMPADDARCAGVFFPDNGKFYAMGGRDDNDIEFTNPFEYDPASNSWTKKAATYPDNSTNNMACTVLNDSGTNYIYCVGGSNFATQTATDRVFRYDPVADTMSVVAASWPPGVNSVLPGGYTVFNNTMIILGGFDIPNGVGISDIWQFTPNPAGFVQKGTSLPVPLGYIPTTTIGSLIYTGGGADITGGALTDTTNSFVYDPVADSINTITPITDATSNTRGVNFCGKMYVLGGNFNAPTNEVQIYDPVSDSWSIGQPFVNARRNEAADIDGTNNIWIAGGYTTDGQTKIASTEVFNCPMSPCGSPSPSPTATATATATATPTPTATPAPRATPTPRSRPTTPAPRP